MRPFWQNTWQGIEFKEVGPLSLLKVARADFYSSFYKILSERITKYDELAPSWRKQKNLLAEFIQNQFAGTASGAKPLRLLSIGAGLAYVESRLISDSFELDLYEFDDTSFFLAKSVFKSRNIICGTPNVLVSDGKTWDGIIINAVDYVFRDHDLIKFLHEIRQLSPSGPILITSASFDGLTMSDMRAKFLTIKALLRILSTGRRNEFQLWGYLRTREDYRRVFSNVPNTSFVDGITDHGIFWAKLHPTKHLETGHEKQSVESAQPKGDAPWLVKP